MKKKADILARTFVKVHSSNNIREEGTRGREATVAENEETLRQNEDTSDVINIPFTKAEVNRALRETKMSSPGKDQICCD